MIGIEGLLDIAGSPFKVCRRLMCNHLSHLFLHSFICPHTSLSFSRSLFLCPLSLSLSLSLSHFTCVYFYLRTTYSAPLFLVHLQQQTVNTAFSSTGSPLRAPKRVRISDVAEVAPHSPGTALILEAAKVWCRTPCSSSFLVVFDGTPCAMYACTFNIHTHTHTHTHARKHTRLTGHFLWGVSPASTNADN